MFGWSCLPAETIRKSPIAQLSGWVRDGLIIETPGDQADFPRIENDILGLIDRLNVIEVDFDRALAAHMQQDLKRALEASRGRDAVDKLIVTVPQTVETMDPAMKMVERLVLAGKLEHDGNPAMAWQIANIIIERNLKDELYPRKAGGKDSPNKIDGPVALFTCLSRAMAADRTGRTLSMSSESRRHDRTRPPTPDNDPVLVVGKKRGRPAVGPQSVDLAPGAVCRSDLAHSTRDKGLSVSDVDAPDRDLRIQATMTTARPRKGSSTVRAVLRTSSGPTRG